MDCHIRISWNIKTKFEKLASNWDVLGGNIFHMIIMNITWIGGRSLPCLRIYRGIRALQHEFHKFKWILPPYHGSCLMSSMVGNCLGHENDARGDVEWLRLKIILDVYNNNQMTSIRQDDRQSWQWCSRLVHTWACPHSCFEESVRRSSATSHYTRDMLKRVFFH
jgi:hypothetical protein